MATAAAVAMAGDSRSGPGSLCSSCGEPFDNNRKRRLVDACGHERCYLCLVTYEQCPTCLYAQGSAVADTTTGYTTISKLLPPPTPATAQSQLFEHLGQLLQHQQASDLSSTTPSLDKGGSNLSPARLNVCSSSRDYEVVSAHRHCASITSKLDGAMGEPSSTLLQQISGPFQNTALDQRMEGAKRYGYRNHFPFAGGRALLRDSSTDDGVISLMSAASSAGSRSTGAYSNVYGSEDSDASSVASAAASTSRHQAHQRPVIGHCRPPARPHSVTTTEPGQFEGLCHDFNSNTRLEEHRRSLRTGRHDYSRRGMVMQNPMQPLPLSSPAPELIDFDPLQQATRFREPSAPFIGRHWVFDVIDSAIYHVNGNRSHVIGARGVIIVGGPGTGKTAILRQLFEHSSLNKNASVCDNTICTRHATCDLPVHCDNEMSKPMSYQGPRKYWANGKLPEPPEPRSGLGTADGCNLATCAPALHRLGPLVVACHLCHVDDSGTCGAAEFVRNVAAQMAQSPRLLAYRNALARDSALQEALSLTACLHGAAAAFEAGIVTPLKLLRAKRLIEDGDLIVLIDSIGDAEYHNPDCGGNTICSLLASLLPKCPSFLHFVVTIRTSMYEHARTLGFPCICLDMAENVDLFVQAAHSSTYHHQGRSEGEEEPPASDGKARDIVEFFVYRIRTCDNLRNNIHLPANAGAQFYVDEQTGIITVNKASSIFGRRELNTCDLSDSDIMSLYHIPCQHLLKYSRGSFLFCKLLLELIEQGHVVIKAHGVKGLPTSLADLFLLLTSLQFPSLRSFERVAPIISLCLASLTPVMEQDMFQCLNAGSINSPLTWDDYQQRLFMLGPCILKTESGVLHFCHPSFREWFMWRDEGHSSKFICDPRTGHALIALRVTRSPVAVSGERTIELGHHILKAHIYKDAKFSQSTVALPAASPRDLQAYWLMLGASDLTSGLVCERNLCTPNLKVSRLLLLCGASVTGRAVVHRNGMSLPILSAIARKGFTEFMAILLEYGAPVNTPDDQGATALCHAAAAGQLNAVKMLCDHGAAVSLVNDAALTQSPLVRAAQYGHLEVVKFLANSARTYLNENDNRALLHHSKELHSSLVAAAANGHLDCTDFLIDEVKQASEHEWEGFDTLFKETALTAACASGEKAAVQLLLARGADPAKSNVDGRAPLLCAAQLGRWDIAVLLVHAGASKADGSGNQAEHAVVAACDTVVELGSRRTALMVASAEGHGGIVEMLLTNGASVSSEDNEGLTALSWASVRGHRLVAQSLIEWGADVEHVDRTGRAPLDLAVSGGHKDVVKCLLEQGARTERDAGTRSPLDAAAACGDTGMVHCFLRRGAKLTSATWQAAEGWPEVLKLLLEKLFADGNTLYRKNRIKDAAMRFQYALKRLPPAAVQQFAKRCVDDQLQAQCDDEQSSSWSASTVAAMRELQRSLLLNLSRCLRKLGEFGTAIDAATAALEMKPDVFDAYYARARAHRDARHYAAAVVDIDQALRLSPDNRELRRLLIRLRDECKQQEVVGSIGGGSQSVGASARCARALRQREPEETSL